MKRRAKKLSVQLLAPIAALVGMTTSACSSGSGSAGAAASGDGGGSNDGGGSGVQPPSPDGSLASTCSTATATPTTLAGTWDVQATSRNGAPTTATIVLDATHFTYAAGSGASLTFSVQGSALSLVWRDPGKPDVSIVTTHSLVPFQQGIIPLALGGAWSFANALQTDPTRCQAGIGVPQFTGQCLNGPTRVPSPLPSDLRGSVTGTRTSNLPSLFGDLGGAWHIACAGQNPGTSCSCDATFSGSTLSVTCADPMLQGTASITFCDGVAAGYTSSGIEFSARRQ